MASPRLVLAPHCAYSPHLCLLPQIGVYSQHLGVSLMCMMIGEEWCSMDTVEVVVILCCCVVISKYFLLACIYCSCCYTVDYVVAMSSSRLY